LSIKEKPVILWASGSTLTSPLPFLNTHSVLVFRSKPSLNSLFPIILRGKSINKKRIATRNKRGAIFASLGLLSATTPKKRKKPPTERGNAQKKIPPAWASPHP